MSVSDRKLASARQRAAHILTECYDGEHKANELLDHSQREVPLPAADAALASELALGIMRHRITCEHLAAKYFRGRWEGLRPGMRVVLAMGVYQLCWLERIPEHAAVAETVTLARRYGKGAVSTANALLRRVAEARGPLEPKPEQPNSRRYLPIDDRRGRTFAEDVFPDPGRKPLDHIIAVTGHPSYLVERWHRRFKPKICRQICDAGSRRPELVLRANVRMNTPEELLVRLQDSGHPAAFVNGTQAIRVLGHPAITELREFREGRCQPQDSTAQLAVQMAAPKPGQFVVDLCAGVGTKSTQAAESMDDRGIVIAADVDAGKLSRTSENAARLRLSILRTVPSNEIELTVLESGREPDLILVDAPCSNTGVLSRRPEARYRVSHRSIKALVLLQRSLLEQAIRLAGHSTRIVFSTCSIESEENEAQVAWMLSQHPGWRLEASRLQLPESDRDGGFIAVFGNE